MGGKGRRDGSSWFGRGRPEETSKSRTNSTTRIERSREECIVVVKKSVRQVARLNMVTRFTSEFEVFPTLVMDRDRVKRGISNRIRKEGNVGYINEKM